MNVELTPEQVQALLNLDADEEYDVAAYSDAMLALADALSEWQSDQDQKAGLFEDCGKYE